MATHFFACVCMDVFSPATVRVYKYVQAYGGPKLISGMFLDHFPPYSLSHISDGT